MRGSVGRCLFFIFIFIFESPDEKGAHRGIQNSLALPWELLYRESARSHQDCTRDLQGCDMVLPHVSTIDHKVKSGCNCHSRSASKA